MKTPVSWMGKLYIANQDRRGSGTEADIVITYRASEIYRKAHKKLASVEELRLFALTILKRRLDR